MVDPLPLATYSFVMSITPGPNNVMLTASGATFGFRRTLPTLLGVSAGYALLLVGVAAGLGALFARWPTLQTILRWAGAAYLVYLGWRLLGAADVRAAAEQRPVSFIEAAVFQFLNPKAWVMTLTAVSLFLPPELDFLGACAYLVGMMVVVNVPCITVWALFGTALRGFLAQPARRATFNVCMALALAGTGVIMVT